VPTAVMNSSYSYSNITCLSDGFAANYESCESFNATACNAFPCKIKVDPDIGGIGVSVPGLLHL